MAQPGLPARPVWEISPVEPSFDRWPIPDLTAAEGPVTIGVELVLPAFVREWAIRSETQAEVDEVAGLMRETARRWVRAGDVERRSARLFDRLAIEAAQHRVDARAHGSAKGTVGDALDDKGSTSSGDQPFEIHGGDRCTSFGLLSDDERPRLGQPDHGVNSARQIVGGSIKARELVVDIVDIAGSTSAFGFSHRANPLSPCDEPLSLSEHGASLPPRRQPAPLRPGLFALLTGETLTAAQMADQGLDPVNFTRVGDAALNVVTQAYKAAFVPPACQLTSSEYARAQGFDFGLIGTRGESAPAVIVPVAQMPRAQEPRRIPRAIAPPRPVPAWARIADRIVYVGIGGVFLFFSLRIGLPIFQAWLALP